MENGIKKTFWERLFDSAFAGFRHDPKAMFLVVLLASNAYFIRQYITSKDNEKVTQQQMYERILSHVERNQAPKIEAIKRQNDAVTEKIDSTTNKVLAIANKLMK